MTVKCQIEICIYIWVFGWADHDAETMGFDTERAEEGTEHTELPCSTMRRASSGKVFGLRTILGALK